MKNAAQKQKTADDEQGVADGAASLGPDGGPAAAQGKPVARTTDDLDEIADEAWLNEELSDEELAELSDEDFNDADFADIDLDADEFDADIDADMGDEFADERTLADEAEQSSILAEATAAFDPAAAPQTPAEDASAEVVDESADFGASQEDASAAEEPAADGGALVASHGSSAGTVATSGFEGEIAEGEGGDIDHRPVPRISIHAFCETPRTTALLEKAAVDRRLAKAHLTIHMGGISKAVDLFQSSSTPNLIILETLAKGEEIFAQLGELAEVCDPSTKVVIIGQVNDIILYRELIRQGISEYIVHPNSPLQIIKTIADLYIDPSAPPIGRTVAFVGARGGVGSSTIAHNVGWCAAEEYKSDTIILDLDLPFGTASLDFDEDASAGLVEALSSPERLDDVLLDRLLQKHTDHLSLFTAPSVLDRDYDMDDQAFETVLDVVRNTAPTIIVDVPHVWTSWSKRILTTADEIIITATPDLAAFRNTKNLIDILSAARPNDAAPKLVINQFDPRMSPVQPDQFAEHVGVDPVQVINWEPQLFSAAATNAAPLPEVGEKSKTAQALIELTAQLLGKSEAAIAKPKFSLMGLFSNNKKK